MAEPGAMEGKVAVVTGGGRGIGRETGLLLAREGARVVVNDPGVSASGTEGDAGPAEETAAEIRAAGGEAVASLESVASAAGGERIVAQALDSFGRVDAVVNNAGILRDGIFHRMPAEDFEAVVNVHLMGAFHVSRAAATHFRRQESGTFVHMTSTSGLIGNIGQANYAAAKMGIVGLSRGIALDMARFGVRSNCIAPFAWSRMIGSIPTDTPEQAARVERMKRMTPAKIAPMAVFLASDLATGVSGEIFAVRGDEIFLMSQPRPLRGLHADGGWTVADVAARLLPALGPGLGRLEVSADVFSWDPP